MVWWWSCRVLLGGWTCNSVRNALRALRESTTTLSVGVVSAAGAVIITLVKFPITTSMVLLLFKVQVLSKFCQNYFVYMRRRQDQQNLDKFNLTIFKNIATIIHSNEHTQ